MGLVAKLSLPSGGNENTLPPSAVSFTSAAQAFIGSIKPNAWFGPGQPMPVVAPPGTLPRSFDYGFGTNFFTQPRQDQPGSASFEDLRALAVNCDLLQIIIQGRINQISKVPWSFRIKPKPGEDVKAVTARTDSDPDINALTDFFERPDREHPWETWLGMLLNEMFVIDAPAIWPVFLKDGKLVSLNLIDGATIKPLTDTQGWRPNPPNPAYQQIIKGMPAVFMTSGMCETCAARRALGLPCETAHTAPDGTTFGCNPLIYYPRKPRVNSLYGFSPVEWIMRTIVLAMNRQVSQISYYTEGNIPEMIIQVPEQWSPDQIKDFQLYMDQFKGDIGKTRRMWFVPETKGITQTKDKILKDDMDEWLARVFCFAFGISSQPFIKSMNRATAQVASEAAAEEGTIPELKFVASLINYIVKYYFRIEGVEFVFNLAEESDGMKRMRVDTGYARVGIMGYDEIRATRGLPPIGVGNMVLTPKGLIPVKAEGSHIDNLLEDNGTEVTPGKDNFDE